MERHEDELFKNVRNNEANTKLSGPNRLSLISQYRIYHMAKKKVSLTKPTRETPSGHERPILPAGVANQITGFVLLCPLEDFAI